MPILDPNSIKKIVRGNFNKSVGLYEQFEKKYGLFKYLTVKLAEQCSVQSGCLVSDIGCGTGTSSFILSDLVGPNGSVVGVDFSEEMIKVANEKLDVSSNKNIKFICCDAIELVKHIDIDFDSILFNASIFLIPEPINTLKVSYQKLVSGGTVGMNYLVGMYNTAELEEKSINLFNYVKECNQPFSPYGRAINDTAKLPELLSEVGFTNVDSKSISKEFSSDEFKAFYSIPAQSAALWPKNSYPERLANLESIIEFLDDKNINKYFQHWGWCSAVKE